MLPILLVFLAMIGLMILGVPVGMCFGAGAIILLGIYHIDPAWAVMQALHLKTAYVLLTFPLYILLGGIIGRSGMAKRIAEFFSSLMSRIKGGMGVTVIVANAVFGALSGSALASLAGIGRALLPELEREGYPKSYAVSLLIPSSVLSCLIPPSGYMIIFGFLGRMSIVSLFLAGAVPGVILACFLIITHLVMSRNIVGVPPNPGFRVYFDRVRKTTKSGIFCLLIPVVVLGSVYGGFATVTESAAIASIYTFGLAFFIYRTINIRDTFGVVRDSARLLGSVTLLLFFFFTLSRVLVIEQVSEQLLGWMLTVSTNKWVLMGMLNVLMLFMGMVMDDSSTIVIAAVILLPIAQSIGFEGYHFAAIGAVNLELGLITPPVAPLLYLGGHIAGDMPLRDFIKPVAWFLLCAFLPTLLLTIFFPQIALFLPSLLGRKL